MKKSIRLLATSLLAVLGLSLCARARGVTKVTARQRYPRSSLIDIGYAIDGGAVPSGLSVRFGTADLFPISSVSRGTHRAAWTTAARGVTLEPANLFYRGWGGIVPCLRNSTSECVPMS